MGVVRCAGVLRPLAEVETTGEFLEKLPLVAHVPEGAGDRARHEGPPRAREEARHHHHDEEAPEARRRREAAHRDGSLAPRAHALGAAAARLRRPADRAHRRRRRHRARQGQAGARAPQATRSASSSSACAPSSTWSPAAASTSTAATRRVREQAPRLAEARRRRRGRRDLRGQAAAPAPRHGRGRHVRRRLRARDDEDGRRRRERRRSAPTPRRVIRAWRDGLDLVPLDGGGWAPLPADWLEQHGQRVADLLAARDATTKKLATAALARPRRALRGARACRRRQRRAARAARRGLRRHPARCAARRPRRDAAPLPARRRRLARRSSATPGSAAMLADDMGLGKTLQTLCALRGAHARRLPDERRLQLGRRRSRASGPGSRSCVYHGPSARSIATADVTLTTYAVLRLDADDARRRGRGTSSSSTRRRPSRTPTARSRAPPSSCAATFRVALTGTPVENRLEELWSLMHFTNPGLLGGRSDFQERYARPIADGRAAGAPRGCARRSARSCCAA